ncbi:MAG: hypothetical protein FD168_1750 [Desulfobulbaceae bacterium]|jgi:hypothetical protein|nr:MAG: hypothetical protein FD168_1750 [Desulfobulbaceae bacterium]
MNTRFSRLPLFFCLILPLVASLEKKIGKKIRIFSPPFPGFMIAGNTITMEPAQIERISSILMQKRLPKEPNGEQAGMDFHRCPTRISATFSAP